MPTEWEGLAGPRAGRDSSDVDLGGRPVQALISDGQLPGQVIGARRGDLLPVDVRNALWITTVHNMGCVRIDMDGPPVLANDGAGYDAEAVVVLDVRRVLYGVTRNSGPRRLNTTRIISS